MIRYFRSVLETLQELSTGVWQAVGLLQELLEGSNPGALVERLEALERNQAKWEAQVESELIHAESRFKAARAAEERARHQAQKVEAEPDEYDEEELEEIAEAYRPFLSEGDGARSPEGGVHPVRDRVETRAGQKDQARLAKWGA